MSEFINTVDVIGDDALTDSIIQKTVTEFHSDEVSVIGVRAFDSCTQLENVDCPNVTSVKEQAFFGCSSLTSANFPLATGTVGSSAFNNCVALTAVNLPLATTLDNTLFNKCSKLTVADFPSVTSISTKAFYQCSALTTANFPLVTTIAGTNAFESCSELTTINFPLLVRGRGYDFYRCSKLTAVDFPSLTSISGNMFNQCSALTTANFPLVTSIDTHAFINCQKFTALILRSDTMATLTNANAFQNTPIVWNNGGYIYVPRALLSDDDETKDYRRATNWSTYAAAQFRALEDFTVDGTITGELDPTKI